MGSWAGFWFILAGFWVLGQVLGFGFLGFGFLVFGFLVFWFLVFWVLGFWVYFGWVFFEGSFGGFPLVFVFWVYLGLFGFLVYGCSVGFVCRLSMYVWSCCWVIVFISLIVWVVWVGFVGLMCPW